MCSRYSLTSPPEAVRQLFGYEETPEFPPRYNIAPTQPVAIVRRGPNGRRQFQLVRWGLIPSWCKDPASFSTLINARAETLLEKASFRGAVRHKRCLVPANCFFEWTGPKGAKRPFMIRPRDGGPIALAGLYEDWMGADGSEIETMAIVTVAANDTVRPLHDRMPAILPPAAFETWLDVRNVRAEEAVALLTPAPTSLLEAVEVSSKLNNPRAEGRDLHETVRTTLF
jgi:putative SOS response-associated peptidase YedK